MKPFLISALMLLTVFFALSKPGIGSYQAKAPAALEIDTPKFKDTNRSYYSKKSHMLKSERYVERPIPKKVWIDTSAFLFFSDDDSLDRFRFTVIGDYEYTAVALFQIINARGVCIYKDTFALMNILDIYLDGGGYYGTRTKKEEAIHEYASELLNEMNIEMALNILPEPLEPEFHFAEKDAQLKENGASKYFVYSRRPDSQTFIGYDPVTRIALKFYEFTP